MSRQEGGSTLVIPPSTSNKPFLFRRKTWTKTPKKSFFSFLMCCNVLKKKQQQKPREKEPSPTASTTTSTLSSVVVPNEFTEKETALVEQPETSQQEPTLGQEVEQQEEQEEAVNYLLDPIKKQHQGRKCLVLDLDETLIHSSFKTVSEADFIVPVEIDGHYHNVFVLKRPGVDDFMKKMSELYEIVIFTASLSKYADPVLDKFDLHNVIHHRLFRESCHSYKGTYIKDLSRLGRDLKHVIILDNTPASYSFHPSNAVPVSTWFNDQHDSELIDLIPFLEDLSQVDDVVDVLNITI